MLHGVHKSRTLWLPFPKLQTEVWGKLCTYPRPVLHKDIILGQKAGSSCSLDNAKNRYRIGLWDLVQLEPNFTAEMQEMQVLNCRRLGKKVRGKEKKSITKPEASMNWMAWENLYTNYKGPREFRIFFAKALYKTTYKCIAVALCLGKSPNHNPYPSKSN